MMNAKCRVLSLGGVAALAAALAACAVPPPYGPNNYPASPTASVEYGRITNVALVSNGTPVATGNDPAGTIIGGVVGGVLGHQIGQGGGQGAATVLGAIGGAAVGSQVAGGAQVHNAGGPIYRVWVQTDAGVMRVFDVSSMGNLRPGDRVRIENGMIYFA